MLLLTFYFVEKLRESDTFLLTLAFPLTINQDERLVNDTQVFTLSPFTYFFSLSPSPSPASPLVFNSLNFLIDFYYILSAQLSKEVLTCLSFSFLNEFIRVILQTYIVISLTARPVFACSHFHHNNWSSLSLDLISHHSHRLTPDQMQSTQVTWPNVTGCFFHWEGYICLRLLELLFISLDTLPAWLLTAVATSFTSSLSLSPSLSPPLFLLILAQTIHSYWMSIWIGSFFLTPHSSRFNMDWAITLASENMVK